MWGVNDIKWGDVDKTMTFLGFELPGWLLGIHFPSLLYSTSIKGKVIC